MKSLLSCNEMRTTFSPKNQPVSQIQNQPIKIISIDTYAQKIFSVFISEKPPFAKFILNHDYAAILSEIYQQRNLLFLSS